MVFSVPWLSLSGITLFRAGERAFRLAHKNTHIEAMPSVRWWGKRELLDVIKGLHHIRDRAAVVTLGPKTSDSYPARVCDRGRCSRVC